MERCIGDLHEFIPVADAFGQHFTCPMCHRHGCGPARYFCEECGLEVCLECAISEDDTQPDAIAIIDSVLEKISGVEPNED